MTGLPTRAGKRPGRVLLTTDSVPLRYLQVQKCGCTFVKNLLWTLQFGAPHPNPGRIHDDEHLLPRIGIDRAAAARIAREEMAFVVIRQPVDRLLSLYLDKLVGEGRRRFPPLAALLAERDGLDPAAASPAAHRANLHILLNWIEANIATGVDLPRNPHWMPFSAKAGVARRLNLKVLLTPALDSQLARVLGSEVLARLPPLAATERNSSRSGRNAEGIVDRQLRRRIHGIYDEDARAYRRAERIWSAGEVPRAGRVWRQNAAPDRQG